MIAVERTKHHASIDKVEQGIIKTLIYFSIFDYPVTSEELIKYHNDENLDDTSFKRGLTSLVQKKWIFNLDQFYLLKEDQGLISRRLKGNYLASEKQPTAEKYSRLISKFPFIRAVMLSGSISKNYMDESSDIDYFIITEPNRLWLSRGLLALYKRLFLFNSKKFFCFNYFIDTSTLQIEEKNLFTAIEIATLIPTYGKDYYYTFIEQNAWVKEYFPNTSASEIELKPSRLSTKTLLERIFSGRLGDWLDDTFLRIADKRWRKLYSQRFGLSDFNVAFKSRKNISKSHPQFFQKRVLDDYNCRLKEFEIQHEFKFNL